MVAWLSSSLMQRLLSFGKGAPVPYKKLDSQDVTFTTPSSLQQSLLRRFSRFRIRLYTVFIVIIASLLSVHIARLNPKIAAHIWRLTPVKPADLHVLIAANESNANLCKTLLTGSVLNYPTPTLINWGKTFNDPELVDGGAQLAKIYGIQEWVQQLRPEQRDGLALIIDDSNAWFQLRPNLLVERFQALLKETNRLTKLRMERGYSEERIGNTVIFAASKKCEPNLEDDIGCYPAPESPLSRMLYGANTDTSTGQTEFSSFRPKYLSSSVVMGPVADIRQIAIRAWSKRDEEQRGQGGSLQSIYNTMFGQQEFMREVFKDRHLSWKGRLSRWFMARFGTLEPSIIDPHPTHEQMEHFLVRSHDFGMALDYLGALVHTTADAEHDSRFITYAQNNLSVNDLDPLDCKPNLQPLPHDIQATYITSPRVQQEVLMHKAWRDMPLYTDMCTGNIPVIIHHGGETEDFRKQLWHQFWMRPIARDLFDTLRRHQLFESPEDVSTDIGLNMGGALTDTGEKLSWDDLCSQYEDEIFAS